MEKLAAAEQKFAEELPPIEALRAWLLLFVDYIAAKLLIAPTLNALVGDPKKVFEASYARIWEAIRALVKRAIKSGDIRKDLNPIDLLRALILRDDGRVLDLKQLLAAPTKPATEEDRKLLAQKKAWAARQVRQAAEAAESASGEKAGP